MEGVMALLMLYISSYIAKLNLEKPVRIFFFFLGEVRDYEAQSDRDGHGMPPALMATQRPVNTAPFFSFSSLPMQPLVEGLLSAMAGA